MTGGERRLRATLLSRFPYAIVYKTSENEIHVVAIAHLSRRPAYWADRVRDEPDATGP
jgi:hypothetical protein